MIVAIVCLFERRIDTYQMKEREKGCIQQQEVDRVRWEYS
jgi:hypothetical protein